eukprot:358921-Chlamydomonas_euryale.AAC.7
MRMNLGLSRYGHNYGMDRHGQVENFSIQGDLETVGSCTTFDASGPYHCHTSAADMAMTGDLVTRGTWIITAHMSRTHAQTF